MELDRGTPKKDMAGSFREDMNRLGLFQEDTQHRKK